MNKPSEKTVIELRGRIERRAKESLNFLREVAIRQGPPKPGVSIDASAIPGRVKKWLRK